MINLDYYLIEAVDPRSKEWLLVSSVKYPLVLLGVYFYLIYSFLPKYMENKKPFALKEIIRVYNVFQVVVCSLLVYGFLTSGWLTKYDFFCEPVDYTNDYLAIRMANVCWYGLVVKVIEFAETIFFLLRKKDNQVSTLHVYHHVSTFLFGWFGVRYFPGGSLTFVMILNCVVHVIMYSYYFLTSFGPEMQKKLAPYKPIMTKVQMIQFVILLVFCFNSCKPSCGTPKIIALFFIVNMVIMTKLFWNFYRDNYLQQRKKNEDLLINGQNKLVKENNSNKLIKKAESSIENKSDIENKSSIGDNLHKHNKSVKAD